MKAIKYYVKGAFQGVKETPQVLEQQEELIADLTAKVADLVAEGKSEEESLGMAIASLGDLSELVAEFELAEEGAAPVPTANVLATRLDLHVVVASVGIGASVMIASAGLGALSGVGVDSGAGLALFGALGVATWWLRSAYLRYQADPDAVETRELVYGPRLRKAFIVWAAVCFAALVLNIATQLEFWIWPIWVAASVWPGSIKVEQWIVGHRAFAAPVVPTVDKGNGLETAA